MEICCLALGSNKGDCQNNLKLAIDSLVGKGVELLGVSPVYKTQALLLKNAPSSYNRVYYNCVVKIRTSLEPQALLKVCKEIEKELGRDEDHPKWSPREIDLDILFYGDKNLTTPNLTVPHKELTKRSFVLDPLSFVAPEKGKYIFSKISREDFYSKTHQPLFMGIINATSDSFSGDGLEARAIAENQDLFTVFKEKFDFWCREGVQIIDIGAESTRPNATPITAEEELQKLAPIFDYIENKDFGYFRPLLSIDSYHPKTMERALEAGFNIINDVSGAENEATLELVSDYQQEGVALCLNHNLGVPADKNIVLEDSANVLEVLQFWLENKLKQAAKYGIAESNIIFDPGIGFGKTASQSLQLLQNINIFHKYGVKIMVGHSRKSFMSVFSKATGAERDIESIAVSLKLADKVDILRVHAPLEHQRALLAYNHLENQFV